MKDYEELTFADDFMFCKILQENEELCKELTELVLGRKIGNIVKPEAQKSIQITADGHGVRFDVYFEDDDKTVYDIEMQKSDTKELPLRSRYYQGMIDLDYLAKGKGYKDLPDSYIIFLCTFDLFKLGYHKYTFVPKCKEVENLSLEDKTNKIYICSGGDKNDVSENMKTFIDYLSGKMSENDLVRRIEQKVKEAIEQKFWRKEYMTLKEMMQDEYEQGIEQGIEQGADRTIIEQIGKKLSKGKTIPVIAAEVEESIEKVQEICDIAKDFAPDYDVDKIYKKYAEIKKSAIK